MVFLSEGFTTGSMSTYQTRVDEVVNGTSTQDGIFDFAPLDSYRSYFNVHRVDVTSNQVGVDPSMTNDQFDTAFDGYFDGPTNKLTIGDGAALNLAADDAPDSDFYQVIFNSSFGRANANYGVGARYTVNNSPAVYLHELGHAIGFLGDEYFPSTNPFGSASELTNLTTQYANKQDMIDAEAKWYRWMINIDSNQLADPAIDVFSGGGGDDGGLSIYRPSDNSRMRNHNNSFDSVGKEAMVIKIYEHNDISTIDSATPEGVYFYDHDFFVDRMSPTHVDDAEEGLIVNWYVDDTLVYSGIGEEYETFNPASLSLALDQNYTIKAEVIDNTYMVRDEVARAQYLTSAREWTFRNVLQVTTDVDENGTNPDALSLREARALAANETPHPGSNIIEFAGGIEEIFLTGHLVVDSDVSIVGPGQDLLTINGNDVGRAFWVQSGKTASISGMSIVNGDAGVSSGGGIFNSGDLTLDRVTLTGNVAGANGGGIYNNGTIRVLNSTIAVNTASGFGGGLMSHADAALGVVIENSAIINNDAPVGGGLYLHVFTGSGGKSARITNSTISGNSATTDGGGVVVVGGTTLKVVQSTITDNQAKDGGLTGKGGGIYAINSTVTLHNSIVADNSAESTYAEDFWTNWGIDATSSHNLIGSDGPSGLTNGGTYHNIVGSWLSPLDPHLSPLGEYGGLTPIHKLLLTSDAIDAGSNTQAKDYEDNLLSTDQRGYTRVFDVPGEHGTNPTVDIGAYEYSLAQVTNVTLSSTLTGDGGAHAPYSFESVVGSKEQLRTVPVGEINRITIQFTKDVSIDSNDLELIALNRVVTEPTPTLVQEPSSQNQFTAIWQLSAALPAAQYLLRLSHSIVDDELLTLDGEWINPGSISTTQSTSTFPSGDNIADADGDFEFVFTHLPGDANRDNSVGILDLDAYSITGTTWSQGDFDGNGIVTPQDLDIMYSNYFKNFQNLKILADYADDFDLDALDEDDFENTLYLTNHPWADLNGDTEVDQADWDAFQGLYTFGIDLDVLV
jgi:hypothetical protein